MHKWWRRVFAIVLAKWMLPIMVTVAVVLRLHVDGLFHALAIVLVGFGVWSLNQIIGLLVGRPRPFVIHQTITPLFTPTMQWKSFPSDHTALATVAAFGVWSVYPILGWIFLGFAIGIGLSRVGAGLHFVSDIVGGLAMGLLLSWITNLF